MNYIQINLKISPQYPWKEVIMQELATIGFESFVDEEKELQAFVNEENFDNNNFISLIERYKKQEVNIDFEQLLIPSQNWNATWEESYPSVKIDKDLLIRAPFHEKDDSYALSLEIQPQMSFGTGHHQTTYLLCKKLLALDFKNKTVLDVGTGTGVLGILASLLGAASVFGTDIEAGAVENAKENCKRNAIENFTIVEGDIEVVPKKTFDVILANINKNVLMRHIKSYSQLIADGGTLLLSGFFENDTPSLLEVAEKNDFKFDEVITLENWAVLKLNKK